MNQKTNLQELDTRTNYMCNYMCLTKKKKKEKTNTKIKFKRFLKSSLKPRVCQIQVSAYLITYPRRKIHTSFILTSLVLKKKISKGLGLLSKSRLRDFFYFTAGTLDRGVV